MHYLHFAKGYFQNFSRYFYLKMQVMFFQKHLLQKLLKVKYVKVAAELLRHAAASVRKSGKSDLPRAQVTKSAGFVLPFARLALTLPLSKE